MKQLDFFGNEYIYSRWTRFKYFPELWGFEVKRTTAFRVWAANVKHLLEAGFFTPCVTSFRDASAHDIPFSFVAFELPSILPGFEAELSLVHYDSWTKDGDNPAERILEWVYGKKYALEHPKKK